MKLWWTGVLLVLSLGCAQEGGGAAQQRAPLDMGAELPQEARDASGEQGDAGDAHGADDAQGQPQDMLADQAPLVDVLEDLAVDPQEDLAADVPDVHDAVDASEDMPSEPRCRWEGAEGCPEGTARRGEGEGCYCAAPEAECEPGELRGGALAEDWASHGRDAQGSRYAGSERALEAAQVGRLRPLWSAPGEEVAGTPAVVDGVVYYGDWGGALTARAVHTGCLLWSRQVSQAPLMGAPLVHQGRVYVGDGQGELVALGAASGRALWRRRLDEHPYASLFGAPVVAGEHLVIGVGSSELLQPLEDFTFRGSVVALSPEDGTERWRVWTTQDDAQGGAGVSVWSSPVVDEALEMLYVGTGNTYEAPAAPLADGLLAISWSGELVWSRQFTEGDVYSAFAEPPLGPDADVGAAPNLWEAEGRPLVGVGDKAGVFSALDRRSGELVWARQLTRGSHLGGVMGAAAVSPEAIYVISNSWPGGWDTSLPFFPDFADPRNDATLFALDRASGQVLWSHDLGAPTVGAVVAWPELVFAGTYEGTVRALRASDGQELWAARPGRTLAHGLALYQDLLVVGHGFQFFGVPMGGELEAGGVVVFGPLAPE